MTTTDHLADVQARYMRARAVSVELQQERKRAVLAALADGWGQRRVAAALGISQARVAQIASGRDR